MYSTIQRLNHYASISTTFVMVLLALISVASFYSIPAVNVGKITVQDLIVQRARVEYGRTLEDVASLRFDVRTDLDPILKAYNTKQLFLYLTAEYKDDKTGENHEVVLWDRIVRRRDANDFRATGFHNKRTEHSRSGRVNVKKRQNHYQWRNPSRSFSNIHEANITLHYSLMPYVGILSQGVAATAQGLVDIPPAARKQK